MSLKLGLRNKIRRSRSAGAGFTGLLDQSFATGATAAYSLRRLKSSATKAVRVRESSGNTETDIGFSGGTLDETALLAHVGSNNGFVTKWYDQSGNGNDASNSTASEQPQIVSGGSVVKENGKPALQFDGSDDFLTLQTPIDISPNGFTSFTVSARSSSADDGFIIGTDLSTTKGVYTVFQFGNGDIFLRDDQGFSSKSNSTTGQTLLTGRASNSTSRKIYQDGSEITNLNTSTRNQDTSLNTLGLHEATTFSKAKAQEVILYLIDKTNNRNNIETNINKHYSIF